MQFLLPAFLLASLAVALPVFLHLTRKQSKRPTRVPSLMLLQNVPVRETQRRRIQQLPLLLLRCLVLLFLAVAFAQPTLDRVWFDDAISSQSRSILFLVDHSLSSSREEIWPQVLESLQQEVDTLEEGDEASIVQFGETAEVVWSWDRRRAHIALAASDSLEPSFSGTSYHEAFRTASELFDDASNQTRELCLITDLQATGLEGVEGQDLIMPSGTEFRLKDVGTEAVNSYLGEVLLNRDVFDSEYPYSLQVEIFSNATVETSSSVTLYIGGEAVDRKMCRLGNEGHGTVRFEPFELRSGISKGRVVLESRDAIRADDSFYFVIERNDPFVVTHLRRGGDVDPYMEQALSSGKNLPFQVTGTSRIDRLSVSDSPVLVLDDLAQPPAESLLRSYLEEGGGILLGLGKNVNAAAYNEKLSRLLPVALGNRQFARSAELPFFNIDEANWTHPLLEGLRETLQEVQFYGYRSLRILKGGQVLARFSSGAPALVEASVGKGKMIVFASSIDRSWTDFPISNAYLPFWQMAVQYAAGWTWQPAALKVGQVLERPGSGSEPVVAQSWEVLDPKGQRLLSLGNPDATKAQLLIPGHYEIRQGKRTDWVAVNSDRAESDLDRLEPEELMAVINSARERPLSLQEERSRESTLQPVWWVFLSLAILLLLGEVFLANGLIPSLKIQTTTAKVGMKSNA